MYIYKKIHIKSNLRHVILALIWHEQARFLLQAQHSHHLLEALRIAFQQIFHHAAPLVH